MALLKRDEILNAEDLAFEDVPVPEWGGDVRIIGLNAKEASSFSKKLVRVDAKGNIVNLQMDNFMAELVALTAVDEKMQPLFSQADVEALGKKSAKALKRVADVAQRLSGMGEGAQEDALKNSNGTPDEDSHSD